MHTLHTIFYANIYFMQSICKILNVCIGFMQLHNSCITRCGYAKVMQTSQAFCIGHMQKSYANYAKFLHTLAYNCIAFAYVCIDFKCSIRVCKECKTYANICNCCNLYYIFANFASLICKNNNGLLNHFVV